jgi:hypothetical protein
LGTSNHANDLRSAKAEGLLAGGIFEAPHSIINLTRVNQEEERQKFLHY